MLCGMINFILSWPDWRVFTRFDGISPFFDVIRIPIPHSCENVCWMLRAPWVRIQFDLDKCKYEYSVQFLGGWSIHLISVNNSFSINFLGRENSTVPLNCMATSSLERRLLSRPKMFILRRLWQYLYELKYSAQHSVLLREFEKWCCYICLYVDYLFHRYQMDLIW